MRVQPKLFGGSEVRGPSSARRDQLQLFTAGDWLAAAQDYARVHGLSWETFTIGQSFKAGGVWFVATWNDGLQTWEMDQVSG